MSAVLLARRKLVALAAGVLLLGAAGAAFADNVVDDVDDDGGIVSAAPGGTVTVGWRVNDTGSDGCAATDATPVTVAISPSGPVTASTSSLTFTSCGSWQSVTFTIASDAGSGDHVVSVDPPDGFGGGDDVTIRVAAAEPPPPPPPPPPPADTTPPVVSVPADLTLETTSAAGATVTFAATANDDVDGSVPVTCVPASGSTFPVGTTRVTCSATDAAGNTGTGSFSVTVTSTNPAPTVQVPATQRVAAFDASGAVVHFVPEPTASDPQDGPLVPVCKPASGTRFPLGVTTVTCTATDSGGATGSATFDVVVVDLTPPVVTPPRDVVVSTEAPLGRDDARIAEFLVAASAADNVGVVALGSNAPQVLPLGRTVVTFTAVDAGGNTGTATATIELRAPAPGQPAPPAAPPPARVPPANVSALRVVPLNRSVRLEWRAVQGAVRYVVTRADRAGATQQVYDGRATTFVDRGLVNGQEYRYVVVSYDVDGLRSVGVAVVAVPRLPVLTSPRYGAGVTRAPRLTWRPVPRAAYYNVQLFRVAANGRRVKILSVWPVRNALQLRPAWTYARQSRRLTRGAYEWYVWAGFGRRAAQSYSPLLGWSRFVVRPPQAIRVR